MGSLPGPVRVALVAASVMATGVLAVVTASGSFTNSDDAAPGAVPEADPTVPASRGAAVPAVRTLAASASTTPRCFGARSMARKRCHNPKLDGWLVPKPNKAGLDMARFPRKQCYRGGTQQVTLNRGCTFGTRSADRPHLILVGDSHARAILPALVKIARAGHISLEAQMRSGCSWTTSGLSHRDKARVATCKKYRKNLNRWLLTQTPHTDAIVTTGYARQVAGGKRSQIRKMRAAWRPMIKRGVRILAIPDNPRLPRGPQKCLRREGVPRGAKACGVSAKEGFLRDPFMNTARATRGAAVLNLRSRFCRKGFCPAVIGGVNVYRDGSHITRTYAKTLAPALTARLRTAKVIR